MEYSEVDASTVGALGRIVGEAHVLTASEEMQPYAHDEVVGLRADPEVVVLASSADEVSRILELAQRERVPVTPRGAGYGLSG